MIQQIVGFLSLIGIVSFGIFLSYVINGPKQCQKCNTVTTNRFCTSCGMKTLPLPRCKYCWTHIYPHDLHCGGCAAHRTSAIKIKNQRSALGEVTHL